VIDIFTKPLGKTKFEIFKKYNKEKDKLSKLAL
jgi:hypothetical protein